MMNTGPIIEQRSIMDRVRSSRIATDKLLAFKVFVFGLGVFLVGDLSELEPLSQLGIWTFLAAFPIFAIYKIFDYYFLIRDANAEIDDAVENARQARAEDRLP